MVEHGETISKLTATAVRSLAACVRTSIEMDPTTMCLFTGMTTFLSWRLT
jgi:hypothetical protein